MGGAGAKKAPVKCRPWARNGCAVFVPSSRPALATTKPYAPRSTDSPCTPPRAPADSPQRSNEFSHEHFRQAKCARMAFSACFSRFRHACKNAEPAARVLRRRGSRYRVRRTRAGITRNKPRLVSYVAIESRSELATRESPRDSVARAARTFSSQARARALCGDRDLAVSDRRAARFRSESCRKGDAHLGRTSSLSNDRHSLDSRRWGSVRGSH